MTKDGEIAAQVQTGQDPNHQQGPQDGMGPAKQKAGKNPGHK